MLIVKNKPIMLSVIMLSAIMLNVVMLRVAMLSVVAPLVTVSHFHPLRVSSKSRHQGPYSQPFIFFLSYGLAF